jgi:putative tryptophan/tyrosine transport system substrate-binding protein
VKRREFITLLTGGAAAWPLGVSAQQTELVRRIGVLIGGDASLYQGPIAKFREELQRRGWTAQNLQIDFRFATDLKQTNSSLAELVKLAPDVLFTNNTPTALVMREKTKTTPIVFAIVTDPVGSGLLSNLAHPDGNVTGFTNYEFSTSGKWLQLLTEIAPGLARAAVIFNPKTAPYSSKYLGPLQDAATSLRVELIASRVADAAEIKRVVAEVGQRSGGGLMTLPDFSTGVHRDLIIAVAARHQVPGIYHYRHFPAAGGLMSYGIDITEQFRQGASYVDRILRGEKPSELPVQAPVKFELVVNLKSARALGLDIPPMLLARADEVIE